jgi:hypothetical protein
MVKPLHLSWPKHSLYLNPLIRIEKKSSKNPGKDTGKSNTPPKTNKPYPFRNSNEAKKRFTRITLKVGFDKRIWKIFQPASGLKDFPNTGNVRRGGGPLPTNFERGDQLRMTMRPRSTNARPATKAVPETSSNQPTGMDEGPEPVGSPGSGVVVGQVATTPLTLQRPGHCQSPF